ncbi:unnamed protein product [Dovyalis caffra]|uniref:Pectinesterase inhibitor domain-containing protein n=1 Tax=Dovyalis caffra TaxID=77055 RepID=A0AAV1RKT4_9ROSI|nr:unnamed protein product [Dovyalis caffra]
MASSAVSKQSHCHSLVILAALALFCAAKICLAEKFKPQSESGDDFIKTSCGVTRYPDLCYKTLSAYADTIQDNPTQLANASLSETLKNAESTLNMMQKLLQMRELRPREAGAIKDCVETMKESVDELQKSMLAMRDLEGPDFRMEMSNIQTWVSAALPDEDTCMDGFQGKAINGNVKDTIRIYIVKGSQLTSIALALINRIQ